jgi:hypothetical protein
MIGIVAVYYYPDYAAGLDRIVDLLKQRLRSAGQGTTAVAVVNNPLSHPDASRFDHVIAGGNQHQEFGAYQEGLDLLRPLQGCSHVVFINDSAHGNHDYRRIIWHKFADQIVADLASPQPAVIGPVDPRQTSFIVRGAPMNRWVSTHYFALNVHALAALDFMVRDPAVEELVAPRAPESSFFSPQLHPSHAAMLSAWLFRPGAPSSWYKAEALGPQNAGRFAQKARSILQEHFLTSKLEWVCAAVINAKPAGVKEKVLARWGPR